MFIHEPASVLACKDIRLMHNISKSVSDNDVIEQYKDEWSWFMQGYIKCYTEMHIKIESKQNQIDKLEFMITQGLGWEDMENDIKYPSGD
jgi:hypothetical protein